MNAHDHHEKAEGDRTTRIMIGEEIQAVLRCQSQGHDETCETCCPPPTDIGESPLHYGKVESNGVHTLCGEVGLIASSIFDVTCQGCKAKLRPLKDGTPEERVRFRNQYGRHLQDGPNRP